MLDSFRSLKNCINNSSNSVQTYLRSAHEALLFCLETSADFIGREDYQPGKISLSQKLCWTPFSSTLRLMVTRNDIEIFTRKSSLPELRIVRKFNGKYMLINGISFYCGNSIYHEGTHRLPREFVAFYESYSRQGYEDHDVTISRIS